MIDRFFRNPRTGRLVIAQPPNPSLGVFLVATAVRLVFEPQGDAGTVVSAVGTVALAVWAIDEIVRDESAFRRVLGAVVLAGLVLGRVS